MPYLVFEYLYRDAGNYKAFGELWLSGSLTKEGRATFISSLDSGEFFVAEQVGVPPLYELLYKESGGRTDDDHAWHTFEGFRAEKKLQPGASAWGKVTDLLPGFIAARRNWNPELSPNFDS